MRKNRLALIALIRDIDGVVSVSQSAKLPPNFRINKSFSKLIITLTTEPKNI